MIVSGENTMTTRLEWYRKHMRPWGYSIGFYDEAFPTIRGTVRRICKHYGTTDRLKFFSFVRETFADKGDRYVCRARTLKRLLAELDQDTKERAT
jgi:hypothetical protein